MTNYNAITDEQKLKLKEAIDTFEATVSGVLGAKVDTVCLIHPQHEEGKCEGSHIMASEGVPLAKLASVLQQGMDNVIGHMIMERLQDTPPPGTTVQ